MEAQVRLNRMFGEEKLPIAVQNHKETIQSLQVIIDLSIKGANCGKNRAWVTEKLYFYLKKEFTIQYLVVVRQEISPIVCVV